MSALDCENPFCLEPVMLQAQFFGRKVEIERALSFLHHLQCVSIVGSARIGKTSFLRHVAHPDIRAQWRLATEQVFVHIDSHALAELDEAACYICIREGILHQIKNVMMLDRDIEICLKERIHQPSFQTAYLGLQTLSQGARDLGLKLVITLDNLDVLNQNRFLQQEFFSALRSLHTTYGIAYLAASRVPIDWLERICPDGPGSPFFNIFQQIPIGRLTGDESRQLVVGLLGLVGARLPEFAVDHILELGDNEPYRLQRAGYIAFQVWQEMGGHLQVEDCREIGKRYEALRG